MTDLTRAQTATTPIPDVGKSSAGARSELLVWLSPSFPTGAFAYSQGLETAVSEGWVTNAQGLQAWLSATVRHGALGNDLKLTSLVARAVDLDACRELADLALSLQPSAERAQEAIMLAANFRKALLAGWPDLEHAFTEVANDELTYAIAVGLVVRDRKLPLRETLEMMAQSAVANLLSAAIRLSVVGQFDSQRVTANIAPDLEASVSDACVATRDDLGSATFAADIASMLHETQQTRLFQS